MEDDTERVADIAYTKMHHHHLHRTTTTNPPTWTARQNIRAEKIDFARTNGTATTSQNKWNQANFLKWTCAYEMFDRCAYVAWSCCYCYYPFTRCPVASAWVTCSVLHFFFFVRVLIGHRIERTRQPNRPCNIFVMCEFRVPSFMGFYK